MTEPILSEEDVLLLLVETVDEANTEGIQISLLVRGVIVSGKLVGKRLYLEAMSKTLSKNLVDDYEKNESLVNAKTAFIHLKNAKILESLSEKLISSKEGVWWQGRLSSVDGFWVEPTKDLGSMPLPMAMFS